MTSLPVCLLALASLFSVPALATEKPPEQTSTFTFIFENDLFGETDAQYTNGLQLAWLSGDLARYAEAGRVPGWLLGVVSRMPFVNAEGRLRNVGFALGQQMYTPEDVAQRELLPGDRPYAGWLYGGVSFMSRSEVAMDVVEFQAGMVGPAALAEQAQDLVHEIRGLPTAKGWDHQLENEPGFNLILEHRDRRWRQTLHDRWAFDVITGAGGVVGNVASYLQTGGIFRLGWNLPFDFGTSPIRPGGDPNAPAARGDPRLDHMTRFGFHVFAGLGGRLVLRDIFLDGNTFADSHSVDKELLVGDFVLGATVLAGPAKLSYTQNFRSREFEGQPDSHNFGSISLSWTF
jgi:hypothetical protein